MWKHVEGERGRARNYELAIPLILVAIVALPLLLQIQNLGIYPDAVNPDYLALRMLRWRSHGVAWVLPGNYLWNRFPILAGGLYHGSLHAYLQLPFLLFGAGVATFQISHMFLAWLVATALFALMRRLSGSWALASAVCGLALLDPAFIFTFFTQAFITTFPDAFVLLACLIALKDEGADSVTRRYFIVGCLLGLAIWGYFIFTFFLPGFFLYVVIENMRLNTPGARTLAQLLSLAVGVVCGSVLYLVGYGLLFHTLGLRGGLDWLGGVLGALPQLRTEPGFGFADQFDFAARQSLSVLTGNWHAATIFAANKMSPVEIAKAAILVVAPLAALPQAGGGSLSARGYRLIGIALLSFLGVAVFLGHKLAGNHYCALVPIIYALFGASLVLLGRKTAFVSRGLRTTALGALLAALAAMNVFFLESFSWRISHGESARLYSPEVNAYPLATRKAGGDYTHVFMTWGTILPFVYLTKGKMDAFEADQLPALLCRNKPLKLAFTEERAAEEAKATLDRLKLAGTIETLSPPAAVFQCVVATVEAPATPRCGG
jgi:hypothetical protein